MIHIENHIEVEKPDESIVYKNVLSKKKKYANLSLLFGSFALIFNTFICTLILYYVFDNNNYFTAFFISAIFSFLSFSFGCNSTYLKNGKIGTSMAIGSFIMNWFILWYILSLIRV